MELNLVNVRPDLSKLDHLLNQARDGVDSSENLEQFSNVLNSVLLSRNDLISYSFQHLHGKTIRTKKKINE